MKKLSKTFTAFLILAALAQGLPDRSPAGVQPARAATLAYPNPLFLPFIWKGCAPTIRGQASADEQMERETLDLLNAERIQAGLKPLVVNERLTQAARFHAWDMAHNHFLGHTGSNGSTVWERTQAACYTWPPVGEIAGGGEDGGDWTAEQMVEAWMNSDGHRGTILLDTWTEFGAGYAAQGHAQYWNVDFGPRTLP